MKVMELIDGYLVFILANAPTTINPAEDFATFGRGETRLYRIRESSSNELINRIQLEPSFSRTFVYKDLVISPGPRLMIDLLFGLHLNKDAERSLPLFVFKFPAEVLFFTILLSLVSMTITYFVLKRANVSPRVKTFWVIMNGFAGIIGLTSMIAGLYWHKLSIGKAQSFVKTNLEMASTAVTK